MRVNTNASLGGAPTFVISNIGNGTRVASFRLKKKIGSFPNIHFSLFWRKNYSPFLGGSPITKIFYYSPSGPSTEVLYTNINYIIDSTSLLLFSPMLSYPENNTIGNPTIIDFRWKKSTTAIKYKIRISSDSLFNSIFYEESDITDTSITLGGFNYSSKYYWRVTATDILNNSTISYVWNFKIMGIPILKLKLTAIPEGMYYPLFNQLSRRDTVIVELHQNVSPYNIVAQSKSVIDSLSFKSVLLFPLAPAGTYYIVVKHFNSISLWSKANGVVFNVTDTTNYNFTSANSQSYGNNQKLKGGKYCLYSGDVDRDDYIDASDFSIIDNGSFYGQTGRFIPSDLNADEIVDADDMTIADNNRSKIVITP